MNSTFLIIALILVILLIAVALMSLLAKDIVISTFFFAFFSAYFTFVWAILGAIDVSFTEAVVGAGAATTFFFATLTVLLPKEKIIKKTSFLNFKNVEFITKDESIDN